MTVRRPLVEMIGIALLSVAAGAAINAFRHDRLPLRLPAAYYEVESRARPIFLEKARTFFLDGRTIFVDARSPEAYREGQIEGACNVPIDRWQDLYPELSGWIEGRKIVVYGSGSGVRQADDVALALASRGPQDSIYVYIGGIEEWRAANLPVRTGDDPVLGRPSDEDLDWSTTTPQDEPPPPEEGVEE